MRVAIDAVWWENGPPSGRNIVRDLTRAWAAEYPGDSLTLFTDSDGAASIADQLPSVEIVTSRAGRLPHALQLREMRSIARRVDAVLTNNFGIGRVPARSVVLLHDTIFARHPEWFTRAERMYLAGIRPSLRHADAVTTGTPSEIAQTVAVWPELAGRMTATGYSVPSDLRNSAPSPVAGVGDRFVLTVGRFNVRKNLDRLVQAYAQSPLCETHQLVMVGPRDGLPPDLRHESRLAQSIVMPGTVSSGQLRWLYERASALVFPTLDEGFGLPVIEAAAFGLPVIASDIPPLREAGPLAATFVPTDTASIGRALAEVPKLGRLAGSVVTEWSDVVARFRSQMLPEE